MNNTNEIQSKKSVTSLNPNKSVIQTNYKPTEIGLIPEDWEVDELQNLGVFYKGKGIKKDEVKSQGIPCVRYGELYTVYNNIISDTVSFISNDVAKLSFKLNYGDLLLAGSGETKKEIGKSAVILREDTFAGGDIVVFRTKNIDQIFLGYLSNSFPVTKQKSINGQGDAVVHIYSSGISKIKIPLPPLPEQRAIAEVLSDTDSLIQAIEQQLSKKRAIKQGAMQQLLTPKEGWEVKKLAKVCWFQEGPGLRNWQFTKKGMKVINVTNLVNGYLDLDKTDRHISIKEFETMYRHFEIDESDIVMASSGNSYSKVAVVRKQDLRLLMNTSVIRFKPLDGIDYNYLFIFLKSNIFKDQIDLLITGGAQPNFGPFHLNKIEIPLPPSKDEQIRISTILTDMDAAIEQIEQKLAKYQQLKQGLMQQLLTGKIRLAF